ncbi:hypothetical protein LY44_02959 [Rhodobacter capsulatus]|nr:hypothetical protein LY44_02959 [Rhodobacter capsulatus]
MMRRMQDTEEKAGRPGLLDPRNKRPAVPHGLRSPSRQWAAEPGSPRDEGGLGGCVMRSRRKNGWHGRAPSRHDDARRCRPVECCGWRWASGSNAGRAGQSRSAASGLRITTSQTGARVSRGHVTASLDGPFLGLLPQDRAEQSPDRGLVWKNPDDVRASLIPPVRRSIAALACNGARCGAGRGVRAGPPPVATGSWPQRDPAGPRPWRWRLRMSRAGKPSGGSFFRRMLRLFLSAWAGALRWKCTRQRCRVGDKTRALAASVRNPTN